VSPKEGFRGKKSSIFGVDAKITRLLLTISGWEIFGFSPIPK